MSYARSHCPVCEDELEDGLGFLCDSCFMSWRITMNTNAFNAITANIVEWAAVRARAWGVSNERERARAYEPRAMLCCVCANVEPNANRAAGAGRCNRCGGYGTLYAGTAPPDFLVTGERANQAPESAAPLGAASARRGGRSAR